MSAREEFKPLVAFAMAALVGCFAQVAATAGVVTQGMVVAGGTTFYEGDAIGMSWAYQFTPVTGSPPSSPRVGNSYVSSDQIVGGQITFSSAAGSQSSSIPGGLAGSVSTSVTFADQGMFNVGAFGNLTNRVVTIVYVLSGFNLVPRPSIVDQSLPFSDQETLHILNADPTITAITGDLSVLPGALFAFGAAATDPGVLDVLTYEWDFDADASYDDHLGSTGNWSFGAEGVYPVALRVSDGDGGFAYAGFSVEVRATAVPEAPSVVALGLVAAATALNARVKRKMRN